MKVLVTISAAVLLGIFISACAMQPVLIEGTAMMPAYNNGDKVLVDKNWKELKRGDVVMFLYPKDRAKSYFKRIIALPGETVEIRDRTVFINGEILNEPYVNESYNQNKGTFPPRVVPKYQYFVLGDNRDNSSDSRYWGTLDEMLITGKIYSTYSKADSK